MVLKPVIRQIKEAMGFDISDTPVEKPSPVTKRTSAPLAPLKALKRGQSPIKNKLPGIYNAPSKATSAALADLPKREWQTLAKEIRGLVEGGGSRASKLDRQMGHAIGAGKQSLRPGVGMNYVKSKSDIQRIPAVVQGKIGVRHEPTGDRLAARAKVKDSGKVKYPAAYGRGSGNRFMGGPGRRT